MQQAERRQHLEKLEDNAHMFAAPGGQLVFAHLVHFAAGNDHCSGGGVVDAGNHIQQGRFAIARGTDDGYKFPFFNVERNPLEDGQLILAHGKTFNHIINRYNMPVLLCYVVVSTHDAFPVRGGELPSKHFIGGKFPLLGKIGYQRI